MEVRIESGWKNILNDEFSKPYFTELVNFVKNDYNNSQIQCYPEKKNIFAAFDSCPWEQLKVVIIGQDPYHDVGQANGLCFSVKNGITHPPSLVNIFKELENDVQKPYPISGDLSTWAKQGVLLLNATLTVRAHQAGSHQGKGWETFTDAVIQKISENKQDIVFLLWGNYAKTKGQHIDQQKHLVLTSGHPSPLSANKGYWFGNHHFSKTNVFLKSRAIQEINW